MSQPLPPSDCYLKLEQVSQDDLKAVPVAGHWRVRSGAIEGARFGGAWHPVPFAKRGPGNVLLVNGMILVPEG